MKKILWILVLGGIGFATWWFRFREPEQTADRTRYEPVELMRGRIESTIETTGIVEPQNRIEIKPPIGGRVEEILIEEGDTVEKGQILSWMSSTERAALLDAARAQGEDELRKWEDIYKPTPLISPLAGTVIARNTEPGQTVTTAEPVFVLSDRLIVEAQVDETDIGSVEPGQHAGITLDAYPGIAVTGTVRQIAYEATTVNNVTIYEVDVVPVRVPDCMKSGMTASLRFIVAAADDVLTLPVDTVQHRGEKKLVLVDADDDPATPPEPRGVRTGLSGDGRVEILSGLTGDERVVRPAFEVPAVDRGSGSPFMPKRKKK
ncbi:efflux RND transporter periplasmic adaptor subunit [Kiritimatiella glycovorans]|uniref:efflux RND transporter periplasmic adaptor subunit n=1 Tax=Kiritimatiella glycovorans TaxID=1307763 RepID=UPI00069B1AF0|nr:efflux RND transporter periplasmic adaptor subunit [Kiritimatiella glycovorans]